jgi:hypothetical protein
MFDGTMFDGTMFDGTIAYEVGKHMQSKIGAGLGVTNQ